MVAKRVSERGHDVDVQGIAAIAWRCIKECKDYEGPPVMCPAHQAEATALVCARAVASAMPPMPPCGSASGECENHGACNAQGECMHTQPSATVGELRRHLLLTLADLGVEDGTTLADIQRKLHVTAPTAMRLVALFHAAGHSEVK